MPSHILKEIPTHDWHASFTAETKVAVVNALENGSILLFPELAFQLLPEEKKFLSPMYANPKSKNINFNPATGLLRGTHSAKKDRDELTMMIKRFMQHAHTLIHHLFPSYVPFLQLGRTSFRPVEISGRVSSYRKDDTRLHVDAFPATPNQGKRILRVFTNINPNGQARLWRVGEPFLHVAKRFLPCVKSAWPGKATLLKTLRLTKSYRTEYDHIMLHIHDAMKTDLHYQQIVSQTKIPFLPNSTWIVQTDHVSHAAMAGQYVLEQTFYLPVTAMVNPMLSPLRTLEQLMGRTLT